MNSVVAPWIGGLKLQQQSVLLLALRGPDGDKKHTAFKHLLRPLRGTVLKAAKYNRMLRINEKADSFMTMEIFGDLGLWQAHIEEYLENEADGAVLHHYTHFMHAAQILAEHHPEAAYRQRWKMCYSMFVHRLHLNPESAEQMDDRLSDWGGNYYGR